MADGDQVLYAVNEDVMGRGLPCQENTGAKEEGEPMSEVFQVCVCVCSCMSKVQGPNVLTWKQDEGN